VGKGERRVHKEGEMRERVGSTKTWLLGFGVMAGLLLLTVGAASADLELLETRSADPWAGLVPTSSRLSLLDLSKLDISHQLVFSYGSNSAGRSDMGGLWRTRLSYPLSGPLTLDLSIGSSLSRSAVRGLEANNLFLETFSLRYRPNDNFLFQLMYREFPSSYLYFPAHPRR
jgi:hypothetical protein